MYCISVNWKVVNGVADELGFIFAHVERMAFSPKRIVLFLLCLHSACFWHEPGRKWTI